MSACHLLLAIAPTYLQQQVDLEVDEYGRKQTKRQSRMTLPFPS
jgi:hypothetical protein